MSGTGSVFGAADPISDGIRRGLRRAEGARLHHLDVEQNARHLVQDAVVRRAGVPGVRPEQTALFAEFVTVALAAGVSVEHLRGWIEDLCGDWG